MKSDRVAILALAATSMALIVGLAAVWKRADRPVPTPPAMSAEELVARLRQLDADVRAFNERLDASLASAEARLRVSAISRDWADLGLLFMNVDDPPNFVKLSVMVKPGFITTGQDRRPTPIELIDHISPDEMLRDLHGQHGAECDRPDLDRRMIDELTPRR